jgi:DNA-3-methyladenine glycosylase I
MMTTCTWPGTDPMYLAYHDTEWGVPEWDGRALWEKLILDGFQAGLSWITILKKRDAFRLAFEGFQPEIIAGWGEGDVQRLLTNSGIVRHRGKIEGAIKSAHAYLEIEADVGFSNWIWTYVDGVPLQNQMQTMADVPTFTPLSTQLSKDLKKAGFTFCGPTIVYAFMQATGMVNDHMIGCPCHTKVAKMATTPPI